MYMDGIHSDAQFKDKVGMTSNTRTECRLLFANGTWSNDECQKLPYKILGCMARRLDPRLPTPSMLFKPNYNSIILTGCCM